MATRSVKRRITIWGVLTGLLVALMLSGCAKESEPAPEPNEPNATMSAPADG